MRATMLDQLPSIRGHHLGGFRALDLADGCPQIGWVQVAFDNQPDECENLIWSPNFWSELEYWQPTVTPPMQSKAQSKM